MRHNVYPGDKSVCVCVPESGPWAWWSCSDKGLGKVNRRVSRVSPTAVWCCARQQTAWYASGGWRGRACYTPRSECLKRWGVRGRRLVWLGRLQVCVYARGASGEEWVGMGERERNRERSQRTVAWIFPYIVIAYYIYKYGAPLATQELHCSVPCSVPLQCLVVKRITLNAVICCAHVHTIIINYYCLLLIHY